MVRGGGEAVSGRLTTHVLDTATGRPAAGMRITLSRSGGEGLGRFITNADGRCDEPLLEGEALTEGVYELVFHVGAWRAGGFYDAVPIRFCVTDPNAHHHVPLILSPFGYSTYKGS
jgi:5-hydroxyisourate hydrolase